MTIPCISVLMPCRNAGSFLSEALDSVLMQPECLELLVADGGSTDSSLELLENYSEKDCRVRIISRSDNGPADGLNQALAAAKGTYIGWLNADDLYPIGALNRAATALNSNPEWLMVYGDGQEFDKETGLLQYYPTLPPIVGVKGFRSHCFICQPTVLFRRSMAVMLGPFQVQWKTSFDFDYWLRAFDAFPSRIGYIPYTQGYTRLHKGTITSRDRLLVALEATKLLAKHFGESDGNRLHNYALELKLGIAELPKDVSLKSHLRNVFNASSPFLNKDAVDFLDKTWFKDGG